MRHHVADCSRLMGCPRHLQVLTPEFNAELAAETLRLNSELPHNPGQRYQGTHLDVRFDDNVFYDRLAKWQPARDALAAMGMDDFAGAGGLIVLTKEARAPTLYWHQVSLTLRSSLRRPLRRLNTAVVCRTGCTGSIGGFESLA